MKEPHKSIDVPYSFPALQGLVCYDPWSLFQDHNKTNKKTFASFAP